MGPIDHIDYLEILSYECAGINHNFPISVNLKYYLHCPVKHETKSENLCFYHLPHVKCHNVFTTAVIDQILSLEAPSNIMRFKLDKSSMQNISKNVFIPGLVKHKSMQKVHYSIWCVRS